MGPTLNHTSLSKVGGQIDRYTVTRLDGVETRAGDGIAWTSTQSQVRQIDAIAEWHGIAQWCDVHT